MFNGNIYFDDTFPQWNPYPKPYPTPASAGASAGKREWWRGGERGAIRSTKKGHGAGGKKGQNDKMAKKSRGNHKTAETYGSLQDRQQESATSQYFSTLSTGGGGSWADAVTTQNTMTSTSQENVGTLFGSGYDQQFSWAMTNGYDQQSTGRVIPNQQQQVGGNQQEFPVDNCNWTITAAHDHVPSGSIGQQHHQQEFSTSTATQSFYLGTGVVPRLPRGSGYLGGGGELQRGEQPPLPPVLSPSPITPPPMLPPDHSAPESVNGGVHGVRFTPTFTEAFSLGTKNAAGGPLLLPSTSCEQHLHHSGNSGTVCLDIFKRTRRPAPHQ